MVFSRYRSQVPLQEALLQQIEAISSPLETTADLDPLMERIGDARYVLLGEASHGTSDYYRWRAMLSQRLIQEKGFSFIAVEGDWPDCYSVNRYIKGYTEEGSTAFDVLHIFTRWPTWLWANWEVAALVEWLRKYNQSRAEKVGFFGLDVYSLWESMESILTFLEKKDPQMVKLAHKAYQCFEPFGGDEQRYAWSTRMVPDTCEDEVLELLSELRTKVPFYDTDVEAAFSTEQNALVMVNAEKYYRAMVRSDANSWNVRDTHMAETLDRLMAYHGADAKAIIWAHNTHVGDARYTDMAQEGMVNIGQLVREQHAADGVVLVGFGSYSGTVIAGYEWGAEMNRLDVPEAQSGSWENLLHLAGGQNRLQNRLMLFTPETKTGEMAQPRGHRAIGVVYQPLHEQFGNYVPTVLPSRYDAFLYIDETTALHPLHLQAERPGPPDTYPWGL